MHTGHLVEFRLGGRKHCIDVEDSITDCGLLRTVDGITLFHESTIEAPASLLSRRPEPVATLRYSYEIRADSAAILLRVTLRAAPGIVLSHLRLTTACDALVRHSSRLPCRHRWDLCDAQAASRRCGLSASWTAEPAPAGGNG